MDDLLREFLTETGEHLDVVDVELVRFEREPGNETILRNSIVKGNYVGTGVNEVHTQAGTIIITYSDARHSSGTRWPMCSESPVGSNPQ